MSSLSSLGLDLLDVVEGLFDSFFYFFKTLLGGGINRDDIIPL
ncbi:hypothetical protein [Corynebacterium belfantii]|nr:hypothetical protein [Corynebacterium belfantii]